MKTYTIKPLQWIQESENKLIAMTILGKYLIYHFARFQTYLSTPGEASKAWRCPSILHAKKILNKDYKERLSLALERSNVDRWLR